MEEHPWYNVLYTSGTRIAVIGVLAVLAVFLAAETLSVAGNLGRPSVPATDTITVSGEGQATVPPDVARITFSVQNSAKTVADAQAATTKQANGVIDYVQGQGIAEKDVRTLSYNITPQYSYRACPVGSLCPTGPGTIVGYEVVETVEVKVRDLASVGTLLEGLGSRGVQNVSGPNFALDDPSAGYEAARADAIESARTRAFALAKELGIKLGKIVNFSETNNGYPYPTMAYGMGGGASDKAAVAPAVPAGENTYTASVVITYEIR